jgi:hypothetical protein
MTPSSNESSLQPDDAAPVVEDEIIYRRIPVSTGWYNPSLAPPLSPRAFEPREDERTGISLVRDAEYNTPINAAAMGPSKHGYYIGVLSVKALRQNEIEVAARPINGVRGHVELPGINADNAETDEVLEKINLLAHELCTVVLGPFPGRQPSQVRSASG